jgi:hypothetical protein
MNRLGGGQKSNSLVDFWNAIDSGKGIYSEKVYPSDIVLDLRSHAG